MYAVITEKCETIKLIQDKVKVINYTLIKWESHDNKKGIIQCKNCQAWEHATLNCHLKPRCLKCAEEHKTSDCAIKEKTEDNKAKLKCANCNKNHPANSITCPIYLERKKYIEAKKANPKTTRTTYIDAPLPTKNAWETRIATTTNSHASMIAQRAARNRLQPSNDHITPKTNIQSSEVFPSLSGTSRTQQTNTGKHPVAPFSINKETTNGASQNVIPDLNVLFEIKQQF